MPWRKHLKLTQNPRAKGLSYRDLSPNIATIATAYPINPHVTRVGKEFHALSARVVGASFADVGHLGELVSFSVRSL